MFIAPIDSEHITSMAYYCDAEAIEWIAAGNSEEAKARHLRDTAVKIYNNAARFKRIMTQTTNKTTRRPMDEERAPDFHLLVNKVKTGDRDIEVHKVCFKLTFDRWIPNTRWVLRLTWHNGEFMDGYIIAEE